MRRLRFLELRANQKTHWIPVGATKKESNVKIDLGHL
jgi:hypothetical protein